MRIAPVFGAKLSCLLAMILTLGLGVGRTAAQEEPVPADPEVASTFSSLRFSFDMGMMPLSGQVVVDEDGSFELIEVHSGPEVRRKMAQGELSAESLEAMQAAAAAVDWDELEDRYFNPMIQDAPGYTIVMVDAEGEEHRVSLDGMADDTPRALQQLYERLHALYRAQRENAE